MVARTPIRYKYDSYIGSVPLLLVLIETRKHPKYISRPHTCVPIVFSLTVIYRFSIWNRDLWSSHTFIKSSDRNAHATTPTHNSVEWMDRWIRLSVPSWLVTSCWDIEDIAIVGLVHSPVVWNEVWTWYTLYWQWINPHMRAVFTMQRASLAKAIASPRPLAFSVHYSKTECSPTCFLIKWWSQVGSFYFVT